MGLGIWRLTLGFIDAYNSNIKQWGVFLMLLATLPIFMKDNDLLASSATAVLAYYANNRANNVQKGYTEYWNAYIITSTIVLFGVLTCFIASDDNEIENGRTRWSEQAKREAGKWYQQTRMMCLAAFATLHLNGQ